jgi:hypothetical protein
LRHSRKISLGLAALPWLFLACWPASQADALPDAQGWNGPGWYVAGSAPVAPKSAATPAYILFDGPHDSQGGCALVYDRLYSPIGVCRLLDTKPGT